MKSIGEGRSYTSEHLGVDTSDTEFQMRSWEVELKALLVNMYLFGCLLSLGNFYCC